MEAADGVYVPMVEQQYMVIGLLIGLRIRNGKVCCPKELSNKVGCSAHLIAFSELRIGLCLVRPVLPIGKVAFGWTGITDSDKGGKMNVADA